MKTATTNSPNARGRYRDATYAAVIALALFLGCGWSVSYFRDAREAAAQASRDLEHCRLMAGRIEQLRSRPTGMGAGPLSQTDLHRRGQAALEELGVGADRLVQIAPDVPRTVGTSAYKEVPSRVTLRDVTLRQVVGFLLAMTGDRSPLQARSLRLYAPRAGAAGGTEWSAEVTLSYLSYEPPVGAAKLAAFSDGDRGR